MVVNACLGTGTRQPPFRISMATLLKTPTPMKEVRNFRKHLDSKCIHKVVCTFLFFDEKFRLLFLQFNSTFLCAAELNDEPLYIVTNEGKLRDFYGQAPDMREAYDVYNPLENIHQHSDRINDQEETYIEPLDDDGKLEFFRCFL